MKGAGSWVFSQVRVVEVEKGWKEKARSLEGFGGQKVRRERRAVAAPRCGGRFGRCWVVYGTGIRVAERRSGAEEMGRQVALRRAL
ncbi:hypothetical protein ABG82_01895 [Mycobacteroides immunogenum]|uniref:Uncharacterized protein n=1 Tax=Mycobacteroides immunogenum TaxID=83262 RepID=A0A7V8RTZ6_9MYCO|nr:hypothetical protein ABG82_01895 [Mycobacteroides immunogenum]ANO02321.1 hypothetical protein BAB75_01885 [Mycobacteroides immunogenum]KIU37573.1 hypothetical protein TL11_26990 [Mycobacteroides immunogenum]KPG02320.1 hypothetical protein AN908_28100 [Mycobacteroides immunogenum]KPG02332.1 hypothetical protein AN909_27610 [Mycobacteroides immunogenum]